MWGRVVEEVTPQMRTQTALPEDLVWFPALTWHLTTICNTRFQGIWCPSVLQRHCTCCTSIQAKHPPIKQSGCVLCAFNYRTQEAEEVRWVWGYRLSELQERPGLHSKTLTQRGGGRQLSCLTALDHRGLTSIWSSASSTNMSITCNFNSRGS